MPPPEPVKLAADAGTESPSCRPSLAIVSPAGERRRRRPWRTAGGSEERFAQMMTLRARRARHEPHHVPQCLGLRRSRSSPPATLATLGHGARTSRRVPLVLGRPASPGTANTIPNQTHAAKATRAPTASRPAIPRRPQTWSPRPSAASGLWVVLCAGQGERDVTDRCSIRLRARCAAEPEGAAGGHARGLPRWLTAPPGRVCARRIGAFRSAPSPPKAAARQVEKGFYRVRAIYDLNGDGKWTTDDYKIKRQPGTCFILSCRNRD